MIGDATLDVPKLIFRMAVPSSSLLQIQIFKINPRRKISPISDRPRRSKFLLERERARRALASETSVSFDNGYRACTRVTCKQQFADSMISESIGLHCCSSPTTSVSAAQADTNEPRTNRGQDDIWWWPLATTSLTSLIFPSASHLWHGANCRKSPAHHESTGATKFG